MTKTNISKRMVLLALTTALVLGAFCPGLADETLSWPPELVGEFARANMAARDAAGGNDGVINGSFGFHTPADDPAWWQVDLGAVQELDRVAIYNRNDISERARKLIVLISEDGVEWREVYRHDEKPFSVAIDAKPLTVGFDKARARFVRLQLTERNYLHLDEIEVYGAADVEKNIALKKPALQSHASQFSSANGPSSSVPEGDLQQEQITLIQQTLEGVLAETGELGAPLRETLAALSASGNADNQAWKKLCADAFVLRGRFRTARQGIRAINLPALRRGVEHLSKTYPENYPNGDRYIEQLETAENTSSQIVEGLALGKADALAKAEALLTLKREALLSNPLLDFDRLLMVRRSVSNLGLPWNWAGNCAIATTGYDNEIVTLSPVRPEGSLRTLYKPEGARFVGDVDLGFDADKMMFSMPGSHGRWQVWEIDADGSDPRQVTAGEEPDVDNYDPCYLPDGRVIYGSTALMHGVPCVNGTANVANLFLLDPATNKTRQLCYDQDHNWCPTVLNNGRVLYLRWEYTDLPHSNSRILFHMNPDGVGQAEYYGSNSYFPNAFFFARAIPNHPSKVVGIATGHHGEARSGRLLILSPEQGRQEADGVVQEIPGWGKKVEPIIKDQLVAGVWPQFLHPYPLSENYFLVSAKPGPSALWGIYLVDTFDNRTLLKELEGNALLEPVPFRATPRPPVVADKTIPDRKDATVYIVDIHRGPGLKGIPRGAVKNLRLFTYVYGYRGMGGLRGTIGMDGPWDIRRVLGTVPVEDDGSALFTVPANTPIAIQPLDAEGKALQLMRSWFTAMPGETLSCVGCHENQNEASPSKATTAARRDPSQIEPWRGPERGFSFKREVQPVLDKHCVGCHDGSEKLADLRGEKMITDWTSVMAGHAPQGFGGKFSVSYTELHRWVRRPGIESDIHLLTPMDFHADTTELVQLLKKGHHGVELDEEGWDRIVTWIDLNTPYHGTWTEILGEAYVGPVAKRHRELRIKYAGVDVDFEAIPDTSTEKIQPLMPQPIAKQRGVAQASQLHQTQASGKSVTLELAKDLPLELLYIPAGTFVMGDASGEPDEWPAAPVKIDKGFWMAKFEITNAQFAAFDPTHDSHVESKHDYQFGVHGFPLDGPQQPAVRVSWKRAMAFCRWLSETTGETFALPTEAQWEYACRAGTATPLSYGGLDDDFTKHANLGDAMLSGFVSNPYTLFDPYANPNAYDDWTPKEKRFNDGGFVTTEVGKYKPNAWGLHDMHGNAWEWTRSIYRPYPYDESDGRNATTAIDNKVVRGGSWYDRPKRCRSAFRLSYRPYQSVFNVGLRVVLESDESPERLVEKFQNNKTLQTAGQ